MPYVSPSRLRAARAIVLAALLSCVFAATMSVGPARAGGGQNFCGGSIPHLGICHGPWVNSLKWVDSESIAGNSWAKCNTAQGWNGGYYNIFEWLCGTGKVLAYQLPATTNGYPSIENPNTQSQEILGLYIWG